MKRTSKRQKITATTKPKAKGNIKKSSNNLLYGLLTGIFTFIINYLFVQDNSTLLQLSINKSTFILISLILSAIIFYSIFKIEEKLTANIAKYTFLILLLYSISISLIPIQENSNEFIVFYNRLMAFQNILMVPTIVLGIISVWIHKAKLQQIINGLYSKKEVQEEKLGIKERIFNPIKKLFSKKEILSTSLLLVIIGISIFTLFYRLDYFDLYSDEAQVTKGAAGYYHTGEYKQWSFIKDKIIGKTYDRARPHLFVVAQSFKVFGISNWAARFPSALFGILLLLIAFFISRFFVRDKTASILTIFSFAFFFEFLLLQHWGRMYAMLMPIYIITFYLAFRILTEKNTIKFLKTTNNSFIGKFLNFNYSLLPLFLIFFYFAYQLHANSLILFPVLFLFSILIILFTKEKKYLFVIVAGIFAILVTWFFINMFSDIRAALRYATFFKGNNSEIYTQLIFGFPFSYTTNLIFVFIGLSSLFIVKNNKFRKKYLILIASSFVIWLTFSYIFKFPVSFRYVSFAVPISIILIIGFSILILKTLFNRIIQISLIALLVISILQSFTSRYNDLYISNFASPARPSVAYKTINKNLKPGELLLRHWGPEIYLDDIDSSVVVMPVAHYKGKPFNEIFTNLQQHDAGWLTWHTHNSLRIDSLVRNYANTYFKKYHGHGVDTTGVEVYYYNKNMLKDTSYFKKAEIFMPTANLNTKNAYSIATWLVFSPETIKTPYYFHNHIDTVFTLTYENQQKSLLIKHGKDTLNILKINNIENRKQNHVVYYQTGGKKGDKFGVFVNGRKVIEKTFKNNISDLVKIKVNPFFKGIIDDIRVYDFVVNNQQIDIIMRYKGQKKSNILYTGNKKFETLFHWQKN
ncbi:MAG: glycosyltransferase family 39 protein [Bacteroidota bacterium]